MESPDFSVIKDLFGKAKIFWSASGYGVDENINPELVEHFGITVVEAMSGATIPLVYDAGGHKEIIENGVNGFLWKDKEELIGRMKELTDNPKLMRLYQKRVILSSKRFGYDKFTNDIIALI